MRVCVCVVELSIEERKKKERKQKKERKKEERGRRVWGEESNEKQK